eukprot:jgi/Bigna1/88657/estExt_fgenesh1_pg.C_360012
MEAAENDGGGDRERGRSGRDHLTEESDLLKRLQRLDEHSSGNNKKKNVETKNIGTLEERYKALMGRSGVKDKKSNQFDNNADNGQPHKPLTDREAVERMLQVAQDAVNIERSAQASADGHSSIARGAAANHYLEDEISDDSEEAADNIVAQALDLARLEQAMDDHTNDVAMKEDEKRMDNEVKKLLKEAENANRRVVSETRDAVEQVCVEGHGFRTSTKAGAKASGIAEVIGGSC